MSNASAPCRHQGAIVIRGFSDDHVRVECTHCGLSGKAVIEIHADQVEWAKPLRSIWDAPSKKEKTR